MKTAVRTSETPRRRSAPGSNERRLVTQHPRRRILSLAAGAAALPVVSRIAWPQAYPTRPVRIMVGFAPGGSSDIVARLISQWLSERLREQFFVENRPGAAGNIATEAVVRAAPDGYTLLLAASTNTINAALYEKLNYNFMRDVAPIAGMFSVPNLVVVNPSIQAKTIPEFIAYANANPGKLNMASGGIGGPSHMAGELFEIMTGINVVHVPYRGAGPALTDLIAGQVQLMFNSMPESIEYIRAGRLRALAVTTGTRSEVLPDTPTVAEWVPGYEFSTWFGLGAPKNTPAEIIDKLNKEINLAVADPKMKARLTEWGGMPMPGSPADFEKFLIRDTEKWGKVAKIAGVKLE